MAGCRREAMSVGGEQARPSMGAGTQLGPGINGRQRWQAPRQLDRH